MKSSRTVILSCVATLFATVTAQAQVVPSILNEWGALGTGPGQFEYPYGVAVGSDGSVYVTDQYNYRIEQFAPMGDFIRAWGSPGSGAGQFGLTIGICVAPSGEIYVADYSNKRVQVFTSNGHFVRIFATGIAARDVAVAPNGECYVLNGQAHAPYSPVEVFDSAGTFEREIGANLVTEGTSVALGSDGILLVSSTYRSDSYGLGVWRFDPTSGSVVGLWSTGELFGPDLDRVHAICVAPDGKVYVCNYPNALIGIMSAGGSVLGEFGGLTSGGGPLQSAADVGVGPDGSVYVVDLLGNRVVHYGSGAVATRNESWGALKIANHKR